MLQITNKPFKHNASTLNVSMLSVIMLNVSMLSAIILSVIMLNVSMLSVIMLNAVAPANVVSKQASFFNSH
jgi:hypothetical protein